MYKIILGSGEEMFEYGDSVGDVRDFMERCYPNEVIHSIVEA